MKAYTICHCNMCKDYRKREIVKNRVWTKAIKASRSSVRIKLKKLSVDEVEDLCMTTKIDSHA